MNKTHARDAEDSYDLEKKQNETRKVEKWNNKREAEQEHTFNFNN